MQIGNSKGLIFVMLLAGAFWMSAVQLNVASASTKSQDDSVSGDVINSKYLAITYQKYLNQKDSDVITGTPKSLPGSVTFFATALAPAFSLSNVPSISSAI